MAGKMSVYLERGEGAEKALIEIEVCQPYSPDILADMTRQAVTAVGAMFPEDDDEDLLERLETAYRAGP